MSFNITIDNISLLILIELAIAIPFLWWWTKRKFKKEIKEIPIKLIEEVKKENDKREFEIKERYRDRKINTREQILNTGIKNNGSKEKSGKFRRVQIQSIKQPNTNKPSINRDKRDSKKDWAKF